MFARAATYFPKYVGIYRNAARDVGFGLLAINGTDPTALSLTPVVGTLAMGTDASLWKADGTVWQLVVGGTGATTYPDDVFITLGDGTAADGGNVELGVLSSGKRRLLLNGVDYVGAADGLETIGYEITTGSATTTTVGVPHTSGGMLIQSGSTDCSIAGGTGGDTGSLIIGSGRARSTLGTSGASGDVTVLTGISDDDASGTFTLSTGTAATGSGGIAASTGNAAAGPSGNIGIQSGTGTTGTGYAFLMSGNASAGNSGSAGIISGSASGDSGVVSLTTGPAGGEAGSVRLTAGSGTTRNGSIVLAVSAAGAATGVVMVDGSPQSKTGAAQSVGADAETGALLLAKRFSFSGAGALTFPVRTTTGTGSATLCDVLFTKNGAAGGAGTTLTIATSTGTWVTIDLNGVTTGTVMRLGTAGVTTDAAHVLATADTLVTVTAVDGAGSSAGTILIQIIN